MTSFRRAGPLPFPDREARAGRYRERLNTDAADYGGSGQGNLGGVLAEDRGYDGQPASMTVTLPPLATVFFENGE